MYIRLYFNIANFLIINKLNFVWKINDYITFYFRRKIALQIIFHFYLEKLEENRIKIPVYLNKLKL